MKKKLQDLKTLFNHPSGQATAWVYSSQMQGAVVGFVINVLLMRMLPKDQYGLFSLFVATLMMLAGFTNMGWSETYVRFAAEYRDTPQIQSITRWFFKRTLICALVVTLLAALAHDWIATTVLNRPDFSQAVLWSCVGAIALTLSTFVIAGFQIKQDFRSYFKLQATQNLIRLLAICGLCFVFGTATPLSSLMVAYALSPLLVVILFLPRLKSPQHPVPLELDQKMSTYQRWFLISLISNTLIGNIDSWILAHYHPNESLAAFGAAGRLAMPVQMLATSITTALLPRLAQSERQMADIKLYLAKLRRWLPMVVAFLALMTWLLPAWLAKIAGQNYADSITLIRLLMLCTIVVVVANPVSLPLLIWGKTKELAAINVVQLILDLILDLIWIPRMGAQGAILATLTIYLFSLAATFTLVRIELKKRSR